MSRVRVFSRRVKGDEDDTEDGKGENVRDVVEGGRKGLPCYSWVFFINDDARL